MWGCREGRECSVKCVGVSGGEGVQGEVCGDVGRGEGAR